MDYVHKSTGWVILVAEPIIFCIQTNLQMNNEEIDLWIELQNQKTDVNNIERYMLNSY